MNSEQLLLRLGLPWDGRTPRSLTRVALAATFQAGTGRLNHDFSDPAQLELFPEENPYGS